MYLEGREPVRDEPVPALLVREVDQARGGDDAGDVAQGHRDDAHWTDGGCQRWACEGGRQGGGDLLFLKRMQTKLYNGTGRCQKTLPGEQTKPESAHPATKRLAIWKTDDAASRSVVWSVVKPSPCEAPTVT